MKTENIKKSNVLSSTRLMHVTFYRCFDRPLGHELLMSLKVIIVNRA